jgi:hypothetical protein
MFEAASRIAELDHRNADLLILLSNTYERIAGLESIVAGLTAELAAERRYSAQFAAPAAQPAPAPTPAPTSTKAVDSPARALFCRARRIDGR